MDSKELKEKLFMKKKNGWETREFDSCITSKLI